LAERRIPVVNPPRGLEWAIDKFAALTRLAALGLPVPPTRFVQSRSEAMDAFEQLGGDCVVKPLFGGEGRGVMRVVDPQLAWTTFTTLEQLQTVFQVQQFVPPGGSDTRLLVVGERVFGVRRRNRLSFRTNVAAGGVSEPFGVDRETADTARRIVRSFGLLVGSVDRIDHDRGGAVYLEVNAIPGWKGAQKVIRESIAEAIIETVVDESTKVVP
jgi:ribosomal protein S6--L-glutamate ligase